MKKTYKIIIYVAIAVFIIGLLGVLPFIISWIYSQEAPSDFFVTRFDASDFLVYYASALSFLGTLILGVLTLVQNKRAQEKTDEINQLQLELQRKSMAQAEERYSQPVDDVAPKFEIKLQCISGTYGNPTIKIKNVSSTIISNLTSILFCVKDNDGNEILRATNMKLKHRSIMEGHYTTLETTMKELFVDKSKTPLTNVSLWWDFSCEDEKYKTHYFRAHMEIANTKNYNGDIWKINQVG